MSADGMRSPMTFDTDSISFGVDNRASGCISNQMGDFPGELTKVSRVIKGYGGARVYNVWMGTMQVPDG